MGNYCCECNNKNIDDGNLGGSIKKKYNEEKKKINKITTCDTKINENSFHNIINNKKEYIQMMMNKIYLKYMMMVMQIVIYLMIQIK